MERCGPKGEKRPADLIGDAVEVMSIVTSEEPEDFGANDGRDPNAKKAKKS